MKVMIKNCFFNDLGYHNTNCNGILNPVLKDVKIKIIKANLHHSTRHLINSGT